MTRDVIIDRLALNAVGSKYQEFLHPRMKGKWRSKGASKPVGKGPRQGAVAPPASRTWPSGKTMPGGQPGSPGAAQAQGQGISPAAPGAQTSKPEGQGAKTPIARQPEAAAGERRLMPTMVQGEQRVMADGNPLPSHVANLKIPPAWTDVEVATDPKSELLVRGKDAKGRVQAVYSEAHWARVAAIKFARTRELLAKRDRIVSENNVNRTDASKLENADAMALVLSTGVRPGSEKDTKGNVKAYGATTLEGRHVVEADGQLRLRFTGKKGVSIDIPVEDKEVAAMLRERKKAAGDDGQLFATDNAKLLAYAHTLDGGKFKTKDFRTLMGTKTAIEEIAKVKTKPATQKEYVKMVKTVAKAVAARLGNTATVALQSYIDPSVFSAWRVS